MNESILWIVCIVSLIVMAVVVFKYSDLCDEDYQQELDKLREEIADWSCEKLVFFRCKYEELCTTPGVGISSLYFEMLVLLEDECLKRGLKP